MNHQEPLLSVIVPFYNNEAFVIAALDSLFAQISDDIEVVRWLHRRLRRAGQPISGAAAAPARGLYFTG